MFRSLLISLLLFVTVKVSAQQYAVTASTQIIPPYSVYLPDYGVPGSDKLRVILVQNDLTQPSYDVRLQMRVEQNGTLIMRTAASFNPKALTLTAGVPTIIGGTDLYEYLNPANIEFSGGFNRDTYERTKSLPEGSYRISFTAFDYRRPQVQVSNTGANIFFFQKSDPPLLNLPVCGSRVAKQTPQFLNFNWSSRNSPNPLPGSGTEYVFSLYEIKPAGSNADYIVRSARPIYELTTESNTIVYGPGEPQLIDSMQYVWTVRARDKSGRDLFSNQGLSQSCTFTYLSNNPFAQNNIPKPVLQGRTTGERSIRLSWTLAPADAAYKVEAYRIQYRAAAKNGVEFDWLPEEKQNDTAFTAASLEPARSYEARLQWRVGGVYGPYSELVTVTTDAAKTFVCGDANVINTTTNTSTLPIAVPGMIFRIGHFDILLTKVSGSAGVFTGQGRVITPGFGIGLLMKFDKITVNTDLVVIKGEMQAMTEGIDKFVDDALDEQHGGNDVGKVKTGDVVPDIKTDLHIFSPENIKVNTAAGTISITDESGKEVGVIDYGAKGKTLPLVIEDAGGNLYNIDKNGKVTAGGKRDVSLSGNAAALAALNTLQLDKGMVTFSTSSKTVYAFDKWKPEYAGKPLFDSSYESLANGKYHVSAKAIVPNAQDEITGTLEQAGSDIVPDSVKFVSGKGVLYPSVRNGNSYTIRISGGPAGDAQELFAVHPKKGGGYISLGKLLVASYAPLQKRVVLIPMKNAQVPVAAIEKSLKTAYEGIGVTYTVSTDESFRNDTSWDSNHDGALQDSKSALLSNGFKGEEKALLKAYRKTHSIDDNAVYLFIVNEVALSDADLAGRMPRQSQYGLIFTKGISEEKVGRTVAHEIGHGDYTLEHTFSVNVGLEREKTENLMDYKSGHELVKFQWDVVHDPGNVWGIFEDDAASELDNAKSRFKCLSAEVKTALKDRRIFYAPDGKVVELPEGAVPAGVFYSDNSPNPAKTGSLSSFYYNKVTYTSVYRVADNAFVGYSYDKDKPSEYVKSRDKKASDKVVEFEVSSKETDCQIKVDGKVFANKDCICQTSNYTLNYNRLMLQVINSDDPLVKAEIEKVCETISELPDDVLQTNNQIFNYYYDNPDLYWMDWNTPATTISVEQLRLVHKRLKELGANIEKLKTCTGFKDNKDIVDFVRENFVVEGSKMSFLTYAQFSQLSVAARVCLIKKLMTEKSLGQRYGVASANFGEQDIILAILSNCKSDAEFYEVITILNKDGSLFDLLSWTYDYLYYSEGNFSKLATAITVAFTNNVKPAADNELCKNMILQGKCLVYDNGYLTAKNKEDFDAKTRKIQLKVSDGYGRNLLNALNPQFPGISLVFDKFARAFPFEKGLDPLEMVMVIPKRDVEAFGTTLVKGVPYMLPAIGVYQLFKLDTKAAIGTSTQLVINTAFCAVGVGALTSASSVSVIVLETVDIGLSTFVTYANSAPELAQDHPEIVKYSNYLAIAYTVGRLGHSVYQDVKVTAPAEMVAARYTDDAVDMERRVVTFGDPGDVRSAEKALASINDNNVYIIVHSDGKNFTVMRNGVEEKIGHRSLARWIEGKKIPADQQIVLLSCSDIKTAHNLSNKLGRPVIANDGWVDLYDNGVVIGERSFVKVSPNNKSEPIGVKIGKQGTPGKTHVKLNSAAERALLNKAALLEKLADYPVLTRWVSRWDDAIAADARLIEKIHGLNAEQLAKLEEFYHPDRFTMIAGVKRTPVNADPPFIGTDPELNISTNYNRHGFVELDQFTPGKDKEFYFTSDLLDGSTKDMTKANKWGVEKFGADRFRKKGTTQCEIKIDDEWVTHTWHHYQDGVTMFPVPTKIHDNFRHSGGAALIKKGLKRLFE